MPRAKLTEAAIRRAKLPEKGAPQIDLWDALSPVALRLSYGGSKTWVCQPRVLRKGRWVPARITLGRWPTVSLADARKMARGAVEAAATGEDPKGLARQRRAELEKRSKDTVAAVAQQFLTQYFKRNERAESTKAAYERLLLEADDLTSWRDRPITSIVKRDIRDVIDQMIARDAPAGANRTLAYLKRFFSWCVEEEYLTASPAAGIKRPTQERGRERNLSTAEIREVWQAFETEGGAFGAIFELALLTGQRRGEVVGIKTGELVNLDGKEPQWELPSTRTKNKLPHIVPLSRQAIEIIRTRPKIGKAGLLFTTTGETVISGFSKAKERIDDTIAANRKAAGVREAMPQWTIQDLRRTVSTRMHEDLEIQPHVVEAVLNHISGHRAGVAGTYNRALYLKEKREALTAWADYLDKLVRPAP